MYRIGIILIQKMQITESKFLDLINKSSKFSWYKINPAKMNCIYILNHGIYKKKIKKLIPLKITSVRKHI